MFSLKLKFQKSINLTGIEALDIRRQLKLSDNVYFSLNSNTESKAFSVDETFARAYFPKNAIQMYGYIPLFCLAPGDVIGDTTIYFSQDLTSERAKELFIASLQRN